MASASSLDAAQLVEEIQQLAGQIELSNNLPQGFDWKAKLAADIKRDVDSQMVLARALCRGGVASCEVKVPGSEDSWLRVPLDEKVALELAVKYDMKDFLRCLYVSGANINQRLHNRQFPIEMAAGNDEMVLLLLAFKATKSRAPRLASAGPESPGCALIKAVKRLDFVAVRDLFERKKKPNVNIRDSEGQTALHIVCGASYDNVDAYDIFELLIKNKADVNALDKKGRTPLHQVGLAGNRSLVEPLLDAGADVSIVSKEGMNAADEAAIGNNFRVCGPILGYGANPNGGGGEAMLRRPLHFAAEANHANLLQDIVYANADVNAVDILGRTPLLTAMSTNRAGTVDEWIVDFLLEAGAKVVYTHRKETFNLLEMAQAFGHTEMIPKLQEAWRKQQAGELVQQPSWEEIQAARRAYAERHRDEDEGEDEGDEGDEGGEGDGADKEDQAGAGGAANETAEQDGSVAEVDADEVVEQAVSAPLERDDGDHGDEEPQQDAKRRKLD